MSIILWLILLFCVMYFYLQKEYFKRELRESTVELYKKNDEVKVLRSHIKTLKSYKDSSIRTTNEDSNLKRVARDLGLGGSKKSSGTVGFVDLDEMFIKSSVSDSKPSDYFRSVVNDTSSSSGYSGSSSSSSSSSDYYGGGGSTGGGGSGGDW